MKQDHVDTPLNEQTHTHHSVGSTEPNISETPSDKTSISILELEKAELQDKYLRLVAEFDNYKKRNAKERIELIQTAGKDLIILLLDALDDCERAQQQFEKEGDIEKVKEGANLIFAKVKTILMNKGLKKIENTNVDFDIEKHEAITEIEVEEDKKGKVVSVVQDGYMLNNKLIRFAKVVVGK